MHTRFLPLALAFLFASCAPVSPPADEHAGASSHGSVAAAERLNSSPRHQEWVEVKNGEKTIYAWVVYPESSEKKPVVLLIHENRGLTTGPGAWQTRSPKRVT